MPRNGSRGAPIFCVRAPETAECGLELGRIPARLVGNPPEDSDSYESTREARLGILIVNVWVVFFGDPGIHEGLEYFWRGHLEIGCFDP